GVAPVPPRREVAEAKAVRVPGQNGGDAARHLARDEVLTAARRLVIEEDAAARVHPVRLAVVDRHAVRVDLGGRVRAWSVKLARLVLGRRRAAEHLGGRGLIEAGGYPDGTNCLQQSGGAQA